MSTKIVVELTVPQARALIAAGIYYQGAHEDDDDRADRGVTLTELDTLSRALHTVMRAGIEAGVKL